MAYIMVIATCSSQEEARSVASGVVERKLAACVQLSPITSYYTWQGKICREPEIRLTMKTRAGLYKSLEAFILDHHSYEVPQIVKIHIEGGFQPYLDWIDDTTRPDICS